MKETISICGLEEGSISPDLPPHSLELLQSFGKCARLTFGSACAARAGSRCAKMPIAVATVAIPLSTLARLRAKGGVKRSRWAVGLNGFTIYTLDSNGSTFELTDIVVGEPHADVFLPPADARPVTIKREEVFEEPPSQR